MEIAGLNLVEFQRLFPAVALDTGGLAVGAVGPLAGGVGFVLVFFIQAPLGCGESGYSGYGLGAGPFAD